LDEKATVLGGLCAVRQRGGYRRASLLTEIEDSTGRCFVRWFHPGNLIDRLEVGMTLRVHGTVGEYNERAIFTNPKFEILPENEPTRDAESARLVPVYPAAAGLHSRMIARAIHNVLPAVLPDVQDPYDEAYRQVVVADAEERGLEVGDFVDCEITSHNTVYAFGEPV